MLPVYYLIHILSLFQSARCNLDSTGKNDEAFIELPKDTQKRDIDILSGEDFPVIFLENEREIFTPNDLIQAIQQHLSPSQLDVTNATFIKGLEIPISENSSTVHTYDMSHTVITSNGAKVMNLNMVPIHSEAKVTHLQKRHKQSPNKPYDPSSDVDGCGFNPKSNCNPDGSDSHNRQSSYEPGTEAKSYDEEIKGIDDILKNLHLLLDSLKNEDDKARIRDEIKGYEEEKAEAQQAKDNATKKMKKRMRKQECTVASHKYFATYWEKVSNCVDQPDKDNRGWLTHADVIRPYSSLAKDADKLMDPFLLTTGLPSGYHLSTDIWCPKIGDSKSTGWARWWILQLTGTCVHTSIPFGSVMAGISTAEVPIDFTVEIPMAVTELGCYSGDISCNDPILHRCEDHFYCNNHIQGFGSWSPPQ